jgi:hypothetical protein
MHCAEDRLLAWFLRQSNPPNGTAQVFHGGLVLLDGETRQIEAETTDHAKKVIKLDWISL